MHERGFPLGVFIGVGACFVWLLVTVDGVDCRAHRLVVLEPLGLGKDLNGDDVPVDFAVLVIQRLYQDFLPQTRDRNSGLVKGQSGHVESALEVAAFFDTHQEVWQFVVVSEPELSARLAWLYHLHIIGWVDIILRKAQKVIELRVLLSILNHKVVYIHHISAHLRR